MRILLAPDKFKGSLSAEEVGRAIGQGIREVFPAAELHFCPLADGGDGSLQVLGEHWDLRHHAVNTVDALGRPIISGYKTSAGGPYSPKTPHSELLHSKFRGRAYIELADASGLARLASAERNPLETSTYGTGLVMRAAYEAGFREQYLLLGGSATHELGMGIAAAFGFKLLDKSGQHLPPLGAQLANVRSIEPPTGGSLNDLTLTLVCDVDNLLLGPQGAAHTYAPQKGADPAMVDQLEKGAHDLAAVLAKHSGQKIKQLRGGGAAGGVPAGLSALFRTQLRSGFQMIAELTDLEQQVQTADLVISGEGQLDRQSLRGKVPSGVARLCQTHEKPLVLVVGNNQLGPQALDLFKAKRIFSIMDRAVDLADAMDQGARYLLEFGRVIGHDSLRSEDE